MAMLNRLPDDLQSRSAGGSQYHQLHATDLFRTSSFLSRRVDRFSLILDIDNYTE